MFIIVIMMEYIYQKMKKVLKKGLLFFEKWNIMWQMSAKGMK